MQHHYRKSRATITMVIAYFFCISGVASFLVGVFGRQRLSRLFYGNTPVSVAARPFYPTLILCLASPLLLTIALAFLYIARVRRQDSATKTRSLRKSSEP